jgi:hypothetical protein
VSTWKKYLPGRVKSTVFRYGFRARTDHPRE